MQKGIASVAEGSTTDEAIDENAGFLESRFSPKFSASDYSRNETWPGATALLRSILSLRRGMILAQPVEDLLQALEEARLPRIASELRAHLEAGVPILPPTIERLLAREESEDIMRERNPREQVIEACAFIAEQLVEPYQMVQEANELAGRLGTGSGDAKGKAEHRVILLAEPEFADRTSEVAITVEELDAAYRVKKWLPEARRMMLARLGEEDVPVDSTEYDPFNPDGGRFSMQWDRAPQRQTDERLREVERGARSEKEADFIRAPWPELDNENIRRELGLGSENSYGD